MTMSQKRAFSSAITDDEEEAGLETDQNHNQTPRPSTGKKSVIWDFYNSKQKGNEAECRHCKKILKTPTGRHFPSYSIVV